MTDNPKPVGVVIAEQILDLCDFYIGASTPEREAEYRKELEAMVTALVESRDAAIKENKQYFDRIAAMRSSVTVICAEFPNAMEYISQLENQREAAIAERDQAVKAFDEREVKWQKIYKEVSQECDALKLENERLKNAGEPYRCGYCINVIQPQIRVDEMGLALYFCSEDCRTHYIGEDL